jgi:hypothetical protein
MAIKRDITGLNDGRPYGPWHDGLQSAAAVDTTSSTGMCILESRGCRPVSVPYGLVDGLFRLHLASGRLDGSSVAGKCRPAIPYPDSSVAT